MRTFLLTKCFFAQLCGEDAIIFGGVRVHTLVDAVVVEWDAEAKVHRRELRGKLLEPLNVRKPTGETGIVGFNSSTKSAAGGRERRSLSNLRIYV